MKHIHTSLLLGFAMIGVALLAIADVIPAEFAQWAPLALLAIVPAAWLRADKTCCGNTRRQA